MARTDVLDDPFHDDEAPTAIIIFSHREYRFWIEPARLVRLPAGLVFLPVGHRESAGNCESTGYCGSVRCCGSGERTHPRGTALDYLFQPQAFVLYELGSKADCLGGLTFKGPPTIK